MMNIDDIKKQLKKVKAPDLNIKKPVQNLTMMDNFIDKLKKQDQKDRKLVKGVLTFFTIYLVFGFLIFVVNPLPEFKLNIRIGGSCLVLAVFMLTLILRSRYRRHLNISYNTNTIEFIKNTEKRLQLFNNENIYIIIPFLLLIDIGECFIIIGRYWNPARSIIEGVLVINLVYFFMLGVGFLFAYRSWKKDKKPLLKQFRELKLGLINNTGNSM